MDRRAFLKNCCRRGLTLNMDHIDIMAFFPQKLRRILSMFTIEIEMAMKQVIQRLGLVAKEDYLVQKRLLENAQKDLDEMKKQKERCGCG